MNTNEIMSQMDTMYSLAKLMLQILTFVTIAFSLAPLILSLHIAGFISKKPLLFVFPIVSLVAMQFFVRLIIMISQLSQIPKPIF